MFCTYTTLIHLHTQNFYNPSIPHTHYSLPTSPIRTIHSHLYKYTSYMSHLLDSILLNLHSSHTTTQIISCGQLLDCEIITTTFLVDNQLSLHSELKSPASLRYENTILQSHSVDFQLLTRLTPITSCPFLRKEEWDEVDKLITTLIASL